MADKEATQAPETAAPIPAPVPAPPTADTVVEDQIARAVEEAKKVATDAAKTPARPRLFVKPEDTIAIDVNVMFRKDTGDVLSVFSTDVKLDIDRLTQFLGHQVLQFKFSKPQYPQIARYRQRSTVIYPDSNSTVVDTSKVRDFLLVYHLKGWNLVDDDNKPITMKFDPNGALSNETLDAVYSLHPSIIDVVLTSLERKLLLT